MIRAALLPALALACAIGPGSQAQASTFVAWQVTGVGPRDVLNVRAYPSPASRIQIGHADGTLLSMTGTCTGPGGRHLLVRIQGRSPASQRAQVRHRWCQLWHDPKGAGAYVAGWVRGRYIRPD